MKSLITDLIGLVGLGLLTAGIYLQFGLPPSLMFSGGLILSGSILAAMRGKRAS